MSIKQRIIKILSGQELLMSSLILDHLSSKSIGVNDSLDGSLSSLTLDLKINRVHQLFRMFQCIAVAGYLSFVFILQENIPAKENRKIKVESHLFFYTSQSKCITLYPLETVF
jgi:hypothetical protein